MALRGIRERRRLTPALHSSTAFECSVRFASMRPSALGREGEKPRALGWDDGRARLGAVLEGAVSFQAFLAKRPSSSPLLTRQGQSLPRDPRLGPGVVRVTSCNVYPVVSVYSAS